MNRLHEGAWPQRYFSMGVIPKEDSERGWGFSLARATLTPKGAPGDLQRGQVLEVT